MPENRTLDVVLRAMLREEIRSVLAEELLPEIRSLLAPSSPAPTGGSDLLPAEEVARICGVKASTVRKWMRDDGLPWTAVSPRGRQKRVRRADLETFLKNRASAPAPTSVDAEVERVLSRHNKSRG